MTPELREKLYQQLARHEGKHLCVYRDIYGIPTVGIGHNLRANPIPGFTPDVGAQITEEQCAALFDSDVTAAEVGALHRWPWMSALDGIRFCVIVNMVFNMGLLGLGTFVNTLRLIQAGKYPEAADSMLRSKWAQQVGCGKPNQKFPYGQRAYELSEQMRTGKWQF